MTTPYYQDDHVTLYHGNCLTEHREWLGADVLVTDPPYGMGLRSGRGGAFGDSEVAGDESTEVRNAALAVWSPGPALVFGRWSIPRPDSTRMVLTWEKGEHVGMGDLTLPWKPNTEEIYVLGTGFSGRRDSSVIKQHAIAGTVGQAGKGTRFHPTEKPVALLERLIEKCPPGTIADPFAGSGATLVAARNLGRRTIGVELEERYCEIIARRLSQGAFDFGGRGVMELDGQGDLLEGLIDDPKPTFTAYKYRFDDLMAGRDIWVKLPCGYCGKIPSSLAATNCGGGTTRIDGIGVQYIICGPCGSSGRMNTPPYEQWQIQEVA